MGLTNRRQCLFNYYFFAFFQFFKLFHAADKPDSNYNSTWFKAAIAISSIFPQIWLVSLVKVFVADFYKILFFHSFQP
jgi:hypothetical protein